jgi:hypothetical protein
VNRASRVLLAAFIIGAGAAVFWLTQPEQSAQRRGSHEAVVPVPKGGPSGTPAPVPQPIPGLFLDDPAPGAVPALPMPESDPVQVAPGGATVSPSRLRADLADVQLALRDYRTGLGENPVGNNAEITRALLGDNLKQIKIPVPNGSQLNAQGELCDRYGTPYFFHQLSGTQMEIRSAGPDRQMWTADDVQR